MGHWHAFLEIDDEGNECVYLQNGDDATNRELFEMVEHDVVDSLPGQADDYLEQAEAEAVDRNGEVAEDDDGD